MAMKKKKAGIAEEIKRVLTAGRRRQGLTQEEAAKKLGLEQKNISYRENHALTLRLNDLLLLAQCYDVEVRIGDLVLGGDSK
jgi:transcriptional regulator with XRE-family HTH domain